MFDGWKATEAAVRSLGFEYAPPVIHEDGYRDVDTGFHTNDAESENKRLKTWSRSRFGKLHLQLSDTNEYIFYINIGKDHDSVMKGLAYANGQEIPMNEIL